MNEGADSRLDQMIEESAGERENEGIVSTRIEQRRSRRMTREQTSDEVRELAEARTTEAYTLRSHLKHLQSEVAEYLPPHAEVIDKSGEKKKRPADWQDIRRWIDSGELSKYLRDSFEMKYPDSEHPDEDVREILLTIKEAFSLFDQLEEIEGSPDTSFDQLSDEQKLARVFYRFGLRELIESRIKRKSVNDELEQVRDRIDYNGQRGNMRALSACQTEASALSQALSDEVLSSPEAYFDARGQQLLEAKRIFDQDGKIYETPYVKGKIGKIVAMLSQGNAVFIHGETGSGKTELAKYIAAEEFEREALIVSGRRGLEVSEITESQDIRPVTQELPEMQREQIVARVQEWIGTDGFKVMVDQIVERTAKSREDVIAEEREKFDSACQEYNKNRIEITSRLQPVFRAAAEGRTVIIDEMNAIPHHTLIALNDLLTSQALDEETYRRFRAGDIADDQIPAQNKFYPVFGGEPIVIAPGFHIIGTGNWKPEDGQAYVGRQTLDTAFLRRFGIVAYDYLPNPTDGDLFDSNLTPEEDRELKANSELYQMLAARVINEDLTAELPEDAFSRLDALARCARIIQDAFSGYDISESFRPTSLDGTNAKLNPQDALKENVLDIGKIVQFIIEPWKKDGFRHPIDYYLFDRFISRSTQRPVEMIFLYKLFQAHEFFKPEDGWPSLFDLTPSDQDAAPQTPIDLTRIRNQQVNNVLKFGSRLEQKLYRSHPETDSSEEESVEANLKFFSPIEVIEKIYGRAPERSRYPDLEKAVRKEGESEEAVEFDPAEAERRGEIEKYLDKVELVITEFEDKRAKADSDLAAIIEDNETKEADRINGSINENLQKIKSVLQEARRLLQSGETLAEIEGLITGITTSVNDLNSLK